MSHILIKRLTVGAAALAGVAALGACGTTTSAAPAPAQNQSATNPLYADTAATHDAAATQGNGDTGRSSTANQNGDTGRSDAPATPRCTTGDLKLEVGKPAESTQYPGQYDLDLTYRNVSNATCALYGVPGVDLVGPDDPNGPVYHLTRVDNGVKYNEVPAGSAASASITFVTGGDGSVGSGGSTGWTPYTIVTTPPGQYTQLSAAWPAGFSVLRQDAATHPGTYVNGILGTVS